MSTGSEHSILPPQVGLPEGTSPLATTERESLLQRIRELEAERDAYRRAAYAWALGQVTQDDIERYSQEEEGLPLAAFLRELQAAARTPQNA